MLFLRLYIVTLFALTTTIASAQDSILLRNKFQQDHESFFDLTLNMEGTTRSNGTDQETSNTLYVLFGFQTDTITESGKANVSFKIHEMDYENPLSTGTKPDLKKLMGFSDTMFHMTLDDRGNIIHAPNLGKQDQLKEQIPWMVFPEGQLSIDGTWSQQRNVPITGANKPIIANTTYTLDSITEEDGKQIAVIQYQTKISEKDIEVNPFVDQPGGSNLVLKFTFKNYSYDGEGTVRFDIENGHILTKEEKGISVQEMESDLSMDGADFPSNVVNSLTLTTKAVYSDTKPTQSETQSEPSESSNESDS